MHQESLCQNDDDTIGQVNEPAGVQAPFAKQAKPALQKGRYVVLNKFIAFGTATKACCNKPWLIHQAGPQSLDWEPRRRSSSFVKREARASVTEFLSLSLGTSKI
jgi:hypothetical protein